MQGMPAHPGRRQSVPVESGKQHKIQSPPGVAAVGHGRSIVAGNTFGYMNPFQIDKLVKSPGLIRLDVEDPDATDVAHEVVCNSISSRFDPTFLLLVDASVAAAPWVRYANARQRGYARVTVTPRVPVRAANEWLADELMSVSAGENGVREAVVTVPPSAGTSSGWMSESWLRASAVRKTPNTTSTDISTASRPGCAARIPNDHHVIQRPRGVKSQKWIALKNPAVVLQRLIRCRDADGS